ncbi:PKSN polyketide synthase for alternapyrone biosynthesis protein [Trichoderma harzianum]|uniref:PKSN polyketide synthase for alternapyrone biosynthesis protein n=1 Tax=Trichoderma harzianum TaxID=5544 RepID=A0A0G0ATC9_TRIHA|nr:PKSN polyketide synthase for alternapyrone biosynthesis protein [Trichoderma harzianum]
MRFRTLTSISEHATSTARLEDYLGRYSHGWTGLRCTVDELKVAGVDDASKGPNVIERLSNAASQAEAAVVVESVLKALIGAAIGIDAEDVDASKPLPEFGVDSLKAVEIRNHTKKELQSDISVFELLSAVPLADLSIKIASKSMLVKVSDI